MSRRIVVIEPFNEYGDWQMPLVTLADTLNHILSEIPPEHRSEAVFEVEVEGDYYGGSTTQTLIRYQREETDEEMAERLEQERLYAERSRLANEARERAILAQLQQKYGHRI